MDTEGLEVVLNVVFGPGLKASPANSLKTPVPAGKKSVSN
jgi:hypothetical protein